MYHTSYQLATSLWQAIQVFQVFHAHAHQYPHFWTIYITMASYNYNTYTVDIIYVYCNM